MRLLPRGAAASLVCALALAAAAATAAQPPAGFVKPGKGEKCPVCGMFAYKYPDWIAELVFTDGSHEVFDGAKDLFRYYLDMRVFGGKSGQKRTISAPRGPQITCKGWIQEAAMRMLMNNLDPDVAERPDDLIVYGGTGKAARNWDCFDAIVRSLKDLAGDETLLVQSGKPVGIFRTHAQAPRVLIANSNLVGRFARWEHFRELERQGLMMYGQMTAGSWIYIGSQGIVQGTYETFGSLARKHFNGSLAGRFVLTAGLGGMGGAQPLAATMNDAAFLGVEVDPARIEKRLATGYCDKMTADLDEALEWVRRAVVRKQGLSVGLVGNAAEVLPELVRRGVVPAQPTVRPLARLWAHGEPVINQT